MVAVFAFISVFDASVNQTYAQKCKDTTDEQIVDYMYAKIKESKQLASQISHINVISTNRAVRFQGFVESADDYQKLEKIALEYFCITLINPSVNELAREKPDGELVRGAMCAGETKPCGDICIPIKDICNITGKVGTQTTTDN